MSKTKNMFIVDCVIYPFQVLVYLDKEVKPLLEYLLKIESEEDVKDFNDYPFSEAAAYMFPSGTTVLRMKNIPQTVGDYGTLAHEIFHIACFILNRVGIKYSKGNDEAYAYLIGYLTKEILLKTDKLR